MQIFTIGYEGLQFDTFIATLTEHNIDTLVDVRALPLSRKRGFSKTSLQQQLGEFGIEYQHWKMLGCPAEVRNRYKNDGDWSRYSVEFLNYLESQEDVISQLRALCENSRCCLLCFEADANFCHRSFVAAELADEDDIVHLKANLTGLAVAA